VTIPRTTLAAVCAVVAAALLAGDLSAASPKEQLRRKKHEAAAVLAQVNALDRQSEASVEAWLGAKYELGVTRKKLAADRQRLRVATAQRKVAVGRLERRVRELYMSPDQPTTLGILLGSSSVSEFLDQLETAQAVSSADHQLAEETTVARNRYARAARAAAAVERTREVALAQRDRERRRIAAMLAERKRLLSSVQSEVVQLQKQEAAEQARLAAQARARLAAAQAKARAAAQLAAQQAAERAREQQAQKERAQQQKAVDPPPAPTTTAAAASSATTAPPTTTASTVPAAPPTTPATAPSSPLPAGHPEAASIALRYLGVKYVWGGATPSGFDCSGLVMYVYAQLGISLPHYAAAQYQLGSAVPFDQLQPGDLVFFDALDHVGIYIGGGQFVHAPHTGDVVKISSFAEYGSSYVGARRI
jgi:cell wall-associated NlpC family hydrolase